MIPTLALAILLVFVFMHDGDDGWPPDGVQGAPA